MERENHKNVALLPEECGKITNESRTTTDSVGLYDYPWMAVLYYDGYMRNGTMFPKLRCGGTIINSRYILTAAHCITRGHKLNVRVRVGDFDIRKVNDCQGQYPEIVCESYVKDLFVEKVIVHEDYWPLKKTDIALLRVSEPMDFERRNVAPICLPVPNKATSITLGGKISTVAGWGISITTQRISYRHRKLELPIWTEPDCYNFFSNSSLTFISLTDYSTTFCAGIQGNDACNGDGGGPLMLQEKYNEKIRMIQFGIVSRGPVKCGNGNPGLYTDVTKYINWILDNIEA